MEYFWIQQGKILLMSHSNKILFGDFVAMDEWVRMQLNNNRKTKFGRDTTGHNSNYWKRNV
jgi:hypothetical protein